MDQRRSALSEVLDAEAGEIVNRWTEAQVAAASFRPDRTSRAELADESQRFVALLRQSLASGNMDIYSPAWADTRELLVELSESRAHQGFSASETALFIFSLKDTLYDALRRRLASDPAAAAAALLECSQLLDRLGLFTTETYQKGREQIIIRQQQDMLELSTPVVTLWDGVLALPVIGTLDSARTQVVMENLLERIVTSGSAIAIIDITGVPTVDTVTAQHLLKTVAAARLMGAECIISGIRPQIAQTIVHLGVDLGTVLTKATLAEAFAIALRRLGLGVTKLAAGERRRREPDDREARRERDEE
ncbi:MAG: STAS domain-containing protein [Vicinamibacterales bacterium]